MKKLANRPVVPLLFALAGLLGAALRQWIYAGFIDSRGLLTPWSLPEILLWLLTAAAVSCALPVGLHIAPRADSADTAGFAVLSVGLAVQFFLRAAGTTLLEKLYTLILLLTLAGLVIGLAMAAVKKEVPFLSRAALCVFFAMNLLHRYSDWSEQPQLINYCFCLFALLSLTLFAYHQAQEAAGTAPGKFTGFLALAGLFFCITSLPRSSEPTLSAAGAVWLLVKLLAKRSREAAA